LIVENLLSISPLLSYPQTSIALQSTANALTLAMVNVIASRSIAQPTPLIHLMEL
jgi:hypothetical protein